MNRATVAYIRWFDSAIYAGPACEPGQLNGFSEMESAGLIIDEDKDKITIAVDRSLETGSIRLVLCIPKVNVRQIQRFRVKA